MEKIKNPFEEFRLPGTRDLGEDSVIDLKVIYNENDEYVALCVGQHEDLYTFGCIVRHPIEEIQDLNMPASCEYGLFNEPYIAYFYGMAYIMGYIINNSEICNLLSKDAMVSIMNEANRKKEEVLEICKAYSSQNKE